MEAPFSEAFFRAREAELSETDAQIEELQRFVRGPGRAQRQQQIDQIVDSLLPPSPTPDTAEAPFTPLAREPSSGHAARGSVSAKSSKQEPEALAPAAQKLARHMVETPYERREPRRVNTGLSRSRG